jgi:IS4 transposase
MFQGVSLQSKGMQLFVDIHSLTKGVYRCKDLPVDLDWEKFRHTTIRRVLVDREFYRATFVKECKNRKIPIIMPCKKFQEIRTRMLGFLNGTRKSITTYLFEQAYQTGDRGNYVAVHLVLIAHNNQSIFDIRRLYHLGAISEEEALKNLAGFFTTYKPWKNQKAFSKFLCRTYKKRWWVETGFSNLNSIHDSTRTRRFETKLAEILMDCWIYNMWQFTRNVYVDHPWGNRRTLTFKNFLREYQLVMKKSMIKFGIIF